MIILYLILKFLFVLLHRSVNASLPQQTRDNGSLYAHVFIYPAGGSPFNSQLVSHAISLMTVYSLPQDESINLLSSDNKLKEVSQIEF